MSADTRPPIATLLRLAQVGIVLPILGAVAPAWAALPCSGAPPIACGATVRGTTAPGPSQEMIYACSPWSYAGSEAVYELTVPSLQAVTVTLSGTGARNPHVFLLRTGCDPVLDLVGGCSPAQSTPLVGPGTYMVVVDASSPADEGDFTLAVDCVAAASPVACNTAVAGAVGGASRVDNYSCLPAPYPGGETIYELTLASPQTVIASLTPTAPLDVAILDASAFPASGTTPCRRGGGAIASALNLPAGRYLIAVDDPAGLGGSYSLRVDCTPGISATPINCGDVNVAADSSGPSFAETYGCRAGTFGQGEAYYRFRPTGRVIASATAQDSLNYDVFSFLEPGAPTSCLGGGATTVTLWNATPGQDVVFSLDSNTVTGTTGLSLGCTPIVATPLACGATTPGLTGLVSSLNGYSCITRNRSGAEALFSFTNPTTQPLAFAVRGAPTGSDLEIAVFDSPFRPTAPACLAGGGPVVSLPSAPPGEYLVVVDSPPGSASVPLELVTICGASALDCSGAPRLSCNSVLAGDTTGGPRTANLYTSGTLNPVYTGPERVFHLSNPARQPVNFLLRNADPRLDLLLVPSCDPDTVLDWNDTAIIVPQLDPGEYDIVVDGLDGYAGPFEIVTLCGGPALDPPVLQVTLEPGECATETKSLYFPTTVPEGDIVFSFDLSGSMSQELDQVKQNARAFYLALNALVPSLQFGLASLVEYPTPYTDTVCGVNHTPSTPTTPWPFRLHQALTSNINLIDTVLQSIQIQGGARETYTTSFHEAATNPLIGWRNCARRLWLNFGDEIPVDCNAFACIGGTRNTGRDPGPDLVTGTADDIELLTAIDEMTAQGIALIHVDSSESPTQIDMWDCLAQRTGGQAFVTDRNANIPGGTDIVRGLVDVIKEAFRACPLVELRPTGPYASWVTVAPASVPDVVTPWLGTFTVTFCVPAGIPPGNYPVVMEATCAGGSSCAPQALGTQQVEIEVVNPCGVNASAQASAPTVACLGESIRLDGSGSLPCGASGLQYRWLDGTSVVCGWSPSPTCDVQPTASTTYRLEVECIGLPSNCGDSATLTVDVLEATAIAGDVRVCVDAPAVLDASGSSVPGCLVPLTYEWRDGTGVVRPAGPDPTYTPPTSTMGTTTYTVVVSCPAIAGCEAQDEAALTVASCTLAVRFESFEAVETAGGLVEVRFRTLEEIGSHLFLVERAATATGPFTQVGPALDAQGPGRTYRVLDPEPLDGASRLYRIVEMTDSGRGDVTAPFAPRLAPPGRTATPTRDASRGRGKTGIRPRR